MADKQSAGRLLDSSDNQYVTLGTKLDATNGETAAGAITIYDNTAASGTILAVLKASIVEDTYEFNIAFATGLTVVTAGASKVTVAWR